MKNFWNSVLLRLLPAWRRVENIEMGLTIMLAKFACYSAAGILAATALACVFGSLPVLAFGITIAILSGGLVTLSTSDRSHLDATWFLFVQNCIIGIDRHIIARMAEYVATIGLSYEERNKRHWMVEARRLGSTMPDINKSAGDWLSEHNRVRWLNKARALGSTMSEDGKHSGDWYNEHNRLYWLNKGRAA